MKETAWIIGHGLLGSSIEAHIRTMPETEIFRSEPFSWNDAQAIQSQFASALRTFGEAMKRNGGTYRIFWAAGCGIMSSTEQEMRSETDALASFLRALDTEENLQEASGVFCLSSSAGGVYSGSLENVITETSVACPTTVYGEAKLEQETLAKTLARKSLGIFIARIANLYGPGQSRTKKQGLLTHIARCMLTRRPIHIYVPFDTMRDYLHVSDAAHDFVNASALVKPGDTVTKIIASQEPATIATIIGLFRRITRQNPLLVTGTNALGASYPHRMCFSSAILKNSRGTNRIGLPEGIAETFAHERLQYAASGMPA